MSELPPYPNLKGGDYRPHYAAREADAYMHALLEQFQRYCRHKWYRRSCIELVGGSVDSEVWDTCEHCGKVKATKAAVNPLCECGHTYFMHDGGGLEGCDESDGKDFCECKGYKPTDEG